MTETEIQQFYGNFIYTLEEYLIIILNYKRFTGIAKYA